MATRNNRNNVLEIKIPDKNGSDTNAKLEELLELTTCFHEEDSFSKIENRFNKLEVELQKVKQDLNHLKKMEEVIKELKQDLKCTKDTVRSLDARTGVLRGELEDMADRMGYGLKT
uniref:Uncharacterized protein n=1 Tax=Sphaerodactylus townsendi TaxID=933632 RepID=A0ACB8EFI5_9SAUR